MKVKEKYDRGWVSKKSNRYTIQLTLESICSVGRGEVNDDMIDPAVTSFEG